MHSCLGSGLQSGLAGAHGGDDFANGVGDELRIIVVDDVTAVSLRNVLRAGHGRGEIRRATFCARSAT